MSVLILTCVFNITALSNGVAKTHVLSRDEAIKIAKIEQLAENDNHYDEEYYERDSRNLRNELCVKAFKKVPDLSWVGGSTSL